MLIRTYSVYVFSIILAAATLQSCTSNLFSSFFCIDHNFDIIIHHHFESQYFGIDIRHNLENIRSE